MHKFGTQYAEEVRELRAAGFDFPAARGYTLANPAQWSRGLKSAVTKAAAFNRRSIAAQKGAVTRRRNIAAQKRAAPRPLPPSPIVDIPRDELEDFEPNMEFFDDGAGDALEEFSDIDFFDFEEGDEFEDDESDKYTED